MIKNQLSKGQKVVYSQLEMFETSLCGQQGEVEDLLPNEPTKVLVSFSGKPTKVDVIVLQLLT